MLSSLKSRPGRAAGAALVLAVVAGAGWWVSRPAPGRAPGLNVLLITIDTLRADAVGVYGRPGGPTPTIDRLAEAGVRFTDAHAHNVVTLPSHANMLSGRLPPDHGIRDNGGFRLPAGIETLATHLQRLGYRTGAFVSAFPLDSRFGLATGFDVYDDRFTDGGPRPAFLIQERSAQRTVALARQWLDAAGNEPWFSWVHVYEPHFPYEPPEPFASRWPGDPYLGEVAAADAALAPLLEPILAAGVDGRTLVVVTSDHGEALGEHGEASHGIFAYEEVLRVPLVIYAPQLFRPRVVDAPARHVDLLPTLLDAIASPVPPDSPAAACCRRSRGTSATRMAPSTSRRCRPRSLEGGHRFSVSSVMDSSSSIFRLRSFTTSAAIRARHVISSRPLPRRLPRCVRGSTGSARPSPARRRARNPRTRASACAVSAT